MHRIIVVPVVALLLLTSATAGTEKEDAIARELVERFWKFDKARDVEEVMKLVDVPFCLDAREIIMDKEKLREFFAKAAK